MIKIANDLDSSQLLDIFVSALSKDLHMHQTE